MAIGYQKIEVVSISTNDDTEKSQKLYFIGVDSVGQGKIDDALDIFYQSFEYNAHPKTAQMISQILYKKKQDEDGFKYIQIAYSLSKNNDSIAFDYAEKLVIRGEEAQAKTILGEIMSRNASYKKAKILMDSMNDKKQNGNENNSNNNEKKGRDFK